MHKSSFDRLFPWFLGCAVVAVPVLGTVTPALAQEGESDLPDKYSVRTEQMLMLTGPITNKTKLLQEHIRVFRRSLDQALDRFKVLPTDQANAPEVKSWCNQAIIDTQVRRDDVDGETQQAVVTAEAKAERCSQVFKHSLAVQHRCAFETKKVKVKVKVKGKKKPVEKVEIRTYVTCNVKSELTFNKYKYKPALESFSFIPDPAFGKGGAMLRRTSGQDKTQVVQQKKTDKKGKVIWVEPLAQAKTRTKASTLSSAVRSAAGYTMIVRRIKAFQIHAPIVSVKQGYAMSCLGRKLVYLDMPFHVVIKTSKGEQRKGFVKARDIYDGCTLTPSMQKEQDGGKRFVIKPMRSEVILGGAGTGVRQGMTLWEMPSMGLNIGLLGGLSPVLGGFATSFGVTMEGNMASAFGVSELHLFFSGRMGATSDTSALRDEVIARFDGTNEWVHPAGGIGAGSFPGSAAALQVELGILKRFYISGPLFAELGFGASLSNLSTEPEVFNGQKITYSLTSFAGLAQGAVGVQLFPRLLVKLEGGYRFGSGTTQVSVGLEGDEEAEKETYSAGESTPDGGAKALLVLLYTL